MAKSKFSQWVFNQLFTLDLAVNSLLGGSPEETISARLGRNWHGSWMEKVVNFLAHPFEGHFHHCEEAHENTPESNTEMEVLK